MDTKQLNRNQIITLARQSKLMIEDGDACYLNDMAKEKELFAFVRLVENAVRQTGDEDTRPSA